MEQQTIRLGQFLKIVGWVATGGEAKHLIQSGQVLVNGQVEVRRKRQLHDGDVVTLDDESVAVEFEPDPDVQPDSEGSE